MERGIDVFIFLSFVTLVVLGAIALFEKILDIEIE